MSDDSQADLPSGGTFGSLLHRIAVRIRRHGPSWIVRRTMAEIRSPLTRPGRWMNAALRRLPAFGSGYGRRSPAADDTLLAFYDLLVEPNTFDVIWFMLAAERRRRLAGLDGLHVVFVGSPPGEERDEVSEYREIVGRSARRDRVGNILLPHAWAIPSVRSVEVLHDRREAAARIASWRSRNVFPAHYSVDLHRSRILDWSREVLERPVPEGVDGAFRASDAALAYVDRWLEARGGRGRAVSITVRHYGYNPARNSNLAEWRRFAQYLIERDYLPVFVPDTESLADGLPAEVAEFPHMSEAAWNMNLRLALYERAFLNLGINNGPAFLFLVDARARGLMFKILTPGVVQNEAPYIASQGFEIGGQIPFCTPFQMRVWEDDDFDVIRREFEAMEARIRESESATVGPEAA